MQGTVRKLFSLNEEGKITAREAANINAYLVAAPNVIVRKIGKPVTHVADMSFGNKPVDGGNLLLTGDEVKALGLSPEQRARFIRRIYGSKEFIRGLQRYCLWIEDQHLDEALQVPAIVARVEGVRKMRLAESRQELRTQKLARHALSVCGR